jgi:hypothetical protein
VLFMFDRKPESMKRGEFRSFSQATVMYTVAAANNAQHSAGQPMWPVEEDLAQHAQHGRKRNDHLPL